MLKHLSIRNVVLITSCDLAFEDGLCVLTGETGAGKSILLDSLGLALGERAETKLIRHGEDMASVIAEFDISHAPQTQAVMEELGLEPEDTLIIRRTLARDGKSRTMVNDQPVSVAGLKRIGETLVEFHGQHDQRGLLDSASHLGILDAFGRLDALADQVGLMFEAWRSARDALDEVKARMGEAERQQDYLQHIRRELRDLSPRTGEEEELANVRTMMMQGEKMAETIGDALRELQGEIAVETALRTAQRILSRSNLQAASQFSHVVESLDRALVEVQESVAQLERIAEQTEYDPNRLEALEERLFALKAAARKFNLSADELPQLLQEVEEKLATLDHQHESISDLENEVADARQRFLSAAQTLSDARAQAAQRLQRALLKELAPLKMPNTRFRIVQEELDENRWNAKGTDLVRFEAATNLGQDYAQLQKIASGGELSRFMLAMKVALSHVKSTPTLIFDEVDTGTGGAVADAIGARLALLSDRSQVLVVTHLPQVAARGNHHLFIEKANRKGQTVTSVRVLDVVERKEELARMLAGKEITEEARGAASKLLEAAVG